MSGFQKRNYDMTEIAVTDGVRTETSVGTVCGDFVEEYLSLTVLRTLFATRASEAIRKTRTGIIVVKTESPDKRVSREARFVPINER